MCVCRFHPKDYPTWTDLCQATTDAGFRTAFQNVVKIVAGTRAKDFNEQRVEMVTTTGSRVLSKYVLLRGATLDAATRNMSPKALKLPMHSVPGEDGSDG